MSNAAATPPYIIFTQILFESVDEWNEWIDSIKYTTLNIVQGGAAVVEDQSHEGLKSRMLAVIGCKQNLFFPFF